MLYAFIEQVIRSEKNCDVRRVVWCEGLVLFVCVCLFFSVLEENKKGILLPEYERHKQLWESRLGCT